MKKHDLSTELVEQTVDALDEVEDAVLGVKTGIKSGDRNCDAGVCPQAPYGVGTD